MTISSTNTQTLSICNGATTNFAFGNKIFSASDLVATLIDTAGNLYAFTASGVNTFTNAATGLSYTVYNIDVDAGCFIVFSAAPTNLWQLDLRTAIAELQSTSIKNQSAFYPDLHEEFFDRITRELQDLRRLTYTFGIHGPDIESTAWPAVPSVSQRLNTNLGFGPTGALQVSQVLASGTLSASTIGQFLYPQTAAEIAASVTPTFYFYIASPRIDPRRYGAAGDGITNDTAAMQTALNVAKAGNGRVCLPDSFNALCGPLSLTWSGNRTTDTFAIEGMSPNGSKITASGASGPLLTIQGSTPTGNPQEIPFILENIGLNGYSTGADTLYLLGLSYFRISGVSFFGSFNKALNLTSSLTGLIDQGCQFDGGNYGIWTGKDGTGSPPNLLKIRDSIFSGAAVYAVYYDYGSELQMDGNDIESNAAAIYIGPNINCASTFGFAKVMLQNNWIEGNTSGYSVLVAAPTAGQLTNITIRGGHIVSAPSGQALKVLGANKLLIEDFYSPSPGDTWNLTANYASIRNAQVATLTDSGITYPTYTNVNTSTQNLRNGRADSFTGTLTGCTTSPTGAIAVNQQGDAVTLQFTTPFNGTSNTTAATITGLPSRYWPNADTEGVLNVYDNAVLSALPCVVAAATGIITLGYGHTFTASGTKGIQGGTMIYRIT